MADYRILPFAPEQPFAQPRALKPGTILQPEERGGESPFQPKEMSFRETIRNFIRDVDSMQKDSSKKIQDFMAGEISDVHDVMMAVEKAGTSFQLMMELRNKMMDAYQEIKRMSV